MVKKVNYTESDLIEFIQPKPYYTNANARNAALAHGRVARIQHGGAGNI